MSVLREGVLWLWELTEFVELEDVSQDTKNYVIVIGDLGYVFDWRELKKCDGILELGEEW